MKCDVTAEELRGHVAQKTEQFTVRETEAAKILPFQSTTATLRAASVYKFGFYSENTPREETRVDERCSNTNKKLSETTRREHQDPTTRCKKILIMKIRYNWSTSSSSEIQIENLMLIVNKVSVFLLLATSTCCCGNNGWEG